MQDRPDSSTPPQAESCMLHAGVLASTKMAV